MILHQKSIASSKLHVESLQTNYEFPKPYSESPKSNLESLQTNVDGPKINVESSQSNKATLEANEDRPQPEEDALPETAVALLKNPESRVVVTKKPKSMFTTLNKVYFQDFYQPLVDRALATNINAKTAFGVALGCLLLLSLAVCAAVIFFDTKHTYEVMVMDESLRVEACLKTYEENRCHPHQRLPALHDYCLDLEICIMTDPHKKAKKSVAFSQLVAENANRMFGSLKIKTVFVFGFFLFGTIIVCNLFFNNNSKDMFPNAPK